MVIWLWHGVATVEQMTFTAAALALAIGVGMGMLGGGGSIVAVPVFTFILDFPPKDAIVTSLAVVGVAAAVGAIGGLVRGVVPVSVALTVGLAAMVGAYFGGFAGAGLDDRTQLAILGAVMFVAAYPLWQGPRFDTSHQPRVTTPALALLGVSTGALTGLVGVGGGFLMVPALVIGAGLRVQQAAAASLLVISLAAFSGLAGYLGRAQVAWSFVLPFAGVAAAGTLAGAHIAARLAPQVLRKAFAIALIIIGTYVFVRL